MAKARKKNSEEISLFPFMSVLASVIGVLVLLIAAIVVSALDTEDVSAIERAKEAEEIKEEIEKLQSDEARLKQMIEEAQKKQRELKEAFEEYERLKNITENADELKKDQNEAIRLMAELNKFKRTIDQITQELPPILEEIEKLKEEIARREAVPKEGTVRIFPAGSGGAGIKPTFVEVNENGLVMMLDKGEVHIRTNEITTHPQFLKTIDDIGKAKDRQIIFLIRDDARAIDVYERWAKNVVLGRRVQPGKLPVVGDGKIDLSLFNQGTIE